MSQSSHVFGVPGTLSSEFYVFYFFLYALSGHVVDWLLSQFYFKKLSGSHGAESEGNRSHWEVHIIVYSAFNLGVFHFLRR